MSDSNFHRHRPGTSHHSNDNRSARGACASNFQSNLHFSDEETFEVEEQSPLRFNVVRQPPMRMPQEQMNVQHGGVSNIRPFHHRENHLPYRTWSNTAYEQIFRRFHQEHFKFHLVCYNILAQSLLEDNRFLYVNCFRNNLTWYRRKDRLFRELLRQDADILCLQELDNYHYEHEFRPTLMGHGYDSIYSPRSGKKSDGCCIFYKKNRLTVIASKAVPFYQKNIRILDRDNCGLIVLFKPKCHNVSHDDLFCVATTHLLFSPKRGDIKLAQIQYFLAEIDQLSKRNSNMGSYYPIILCGDFNSLPQSPLIQFLLNRYIKYDNYLCIDISGQTPGSIVNGRLSHQLPSNELLPSSFVTSDCRLATSSNEQPFQHNYVQQSRAVLTHNKKFLSVYDLINSSDVTTNAGDEPNEVDYIFYTHHDHSHRLNLLSRYELYKRNQMIDIHMPNHQFASDHFLLGAEFALKLRKIN